MILSGTKHINGMDFIPPNSLSTEIAGPAITLNQVHTNILKLQAIQMLHPDNVKAFDWSGISPAGDAMRRKLHPKTSDLVLDGVLMQGNCGNCWAMSSTSVLTDRFIIAKGLSGLHLNPLILTDCDHIQSNGCNGGLPFYAGEYFERSGTYKVNDNPGCDTWKNTWNSYVQKYGKKSSVKIDTTFPSCGQLLNTCGNSIIYKAKRGSSKRLLVSGAGNRANQIKATITQIKTEIMTKGPVVGCFSVYADFPLGNGLAGSKGHEFNWQDTKGIYINGFYQNSIGQLVGPNNPAVVQAKQSKFNQGKYKFGDLYLGGHAVVIVGWDSETIEINGKDMEVEYWIVKNSWSADWGERGYFKYAITKSENGFNWKCGMGVGVDMRLTLSGISSGQYNFGAVSFDADPNTGDSFGKKYHDDSGGTHKKYLTTVLIIIGIVLVLGFFTYLYCRKHAKKRGRKSKL